MKTTKQKLNISLLRRIKQHILSKPGRFFMRWYKENPPPNSLIDGDYCNFRQRVPSCGTVACIGGWACLFSGLKECRVNAVDALGVTEVQAQVLFYDVSWPEPFSTNYRRAKSAREGAIVAAARIEHLITTGE